MSRSNRIFLVFEQERVPLRLLKSIIRNSGNEKFRLKVPLPPPNMVNLTQRDSFTNSSISFFSWKKKCNIVHLFTPVPLQSSMKTVVYHLQRISYKYSPLPFDKKKGKANRPHLKANLLAHSSETPYTFPNSSLLITCRRETSAKFNPKKRLNIVKSP